MENKTNNNQKSIEGEQYKYISNDILQIKEKELRQKNEELNLKIHDAEMNIDDVQSIISNLTIHGNHSMHRDKRNHDNSCTDQSKTRKDGSSHIYDENNEEEEDDDDDMRQFFEDITNFDGSNHHINNDNVDEKQSSVTKSLQKKKHNTKGNTNDQNNVNTTTHLHKVQIKALTTKLNDAIESSSMLSKSNSTLQSEVSNLQKVNNKLQRQISKLEKDVNNKVHESKNVQSRINDLSVENQCLKKEVIGLRNIVKDCQSKSQTNEMKLKRSLESMEKYKAMMKNIKSMKDEDNGLYKEKKNEYEKKINGLIKQRDNLILGFKKQNQLIQLLKRQIVHLEASRLLDFEEDEFLKVLDWGEHIGDSMSKSTTNKKA